jgi:hypothetical protein
MGSILIMMEEGMLILGLVDPRWDQDVEVYGLGEEFRRKSYESEGKRTTIPKEGLFY